jgi:hypothetical protein
MLNFKRKKLGAAVSLSLALFVAGCGPEEANDGGDKQNGTTSNGQH